MPFHISRTEATASLTALLAGSMLPLSMAPWNWWPLGILSVAILAFLLAGCRPRNAFTRSLCFAIGQFSVGVSWVYVSINGYGEVPVPLALLMTGAFVLLLGLVFAVPFTLLGQLRRRHCIAFLFAFPATWVASEWLRGWFLTGFPWLYLGYGHVESWASGWGPLIGVQGIGWIIAFLGAALASTLYWFQSRLVVGISVLISILISTSSFYIDDKEWTLETGEPLNIGMIQPALTLEQKWDAEEIINILQLYNAMNEALLKNDIIVWPESAIPVLKHYVETYLQETAKKAAANNVSLILGIPSMNQATQQYYNSIISIGQGQGIYHKQRLVPFGEYVPLETLIRGSIKFFDLPMSSFSRGNKNQPLLSAANYQIGTYICYEIAYPNLVSKTAGDANILLTVSNDTWFGSSISPDQHLQIAQMRALENSKPLIRATNDGLSAIIDHNGRLLTIAPQFERTTLEGTVTARQGGTPYNTYGNWPIYLISLCSLLPCLLLPFQERKFFLSRS